MANYCNASDCEIVRDHPDYPGEVVLVDETFEPLFHLPEEWSDAQIWAALDLMNTAHELGVQFGENRRALAIRTLLEVPSS